MAKKLKVFQAQFGFYDTVVAAASQAAALRAWGTHQNLFASGQAKVTTDTAAVAAALAHADTPLRRAVGSCDPFVLEPTSLPIVPSASRSIKSEPAIKAKTKAPAKPPPDRSKLDAAEEALRSLDEGRKREEAAFRRDAGDLEARRLKAQSGYVDARKAATGKIVEARTIYRKAGGEH